MFHSIKGTDVIYLIGTALFILFQYKLKAYSFGDAKLFIVVLELLTMSLYNIDILIGYMLIEFITGIFLFFMC